MIYDCFTFFNELDLLEVRLHELAGIVDRFVLVEATKTFQGNEKPLYFEENKNRFAAFKDQITHIVVEFPDVLPSPLFQKHSQAWLREFYQRNQISRGLSQAKPEDLVIVSDVDEIIMASKLSDVLESRSSADLTVFEMPMFNGFIDRKQHDLRWELGPRMLEYRFFTGAQKLRLTKLHSTKKNRGSLIHRCHTRLWNGLNCQIFNKPTMVADAGWHITSLGGWQALRTKIDSFAHEEGKLNERYLHEDSFTRYILNSTNPVSLDQLPRFIQENPTKFPFFEKQ